MDNCAHAIYWMNALICIILYAISYYGLHNHVYIKMVIIHKKQSIGLYLLAFLLILVYSIKAMFMCCVNRFGIMLLDQPLRGNSH